MIVSNASRVAMLIGIVFGMIFQIHTLGWPIPDPVPGANPADALLGPMTAMVWNLFGYFIKSLVFGFILALVTKLVRNILTIWLF